METLKKTLEQMSSTFSSNEFSKKAKKNGVLRKEINNGVLALFLHRNAIQGDTRRMWTKKNVVAENNVVSKKVSSDKISEAIELLKNNGYRILKPVSDWVEL